MSSGMRFLDDLQLYWVWSANGPGHSGNFYGWWFVEGMIPCPVSCTIARDMDQRGFSTTPYVKGLWFDHWDSDDGQHYTPVFSPPHMVDISGDLPDLSHVAVLPEKLPQSYLDLLACYTASGKLRKPQSVNGDLDNN